MARQRRNSKKRELLCACLVALMIVLLGCSGGGGGGSTPPASGSSSGGYIPPATESVTPTSSPTETSTETASSTLTPTPTETIPPHNISGKITDKSGQPLINATVKIFSLNVTSSRLSDRTEVGQTHTNGHGNYYHSLGNGHYEVEVQRPDGRWVYVRDAVIADDIVNVGQIAVGFYEISNTRRKSTIIHRLEGYMPFFAVERNPSNGEFYVGPFQDNNNLLVVDQNFTTVREYTVRAQSGTNDQPYDFAYNATNSHLYIALNVSRNIAEIDINNPITVLRYYNTSNITPYGIALTTDGTYFYMSSNVDEGNKIHKCQFIGGQVNIIRQYDINSNVSSLDYENGKFYAFDQRHGTVTIFTLDDTNNGIIIEYQGNIDPTIDFPQAIKNIGQTMFACPINKPVVIEMTQQ